MFAIPNDEIQFTFARSSGPGGQNVNKVNSKAILSWNIARSSAVPEDVKTRFFDRFKNRVNMEGEVVIACDESRDQKTNQRLCLEKLAVMLNDVAVPPKPRKPTKPSRAQKQLRLQAKKMRSENKQQRKKINY